MLKIDPFKQSPFHCGPASLKMVLGYFGIRKSERELARLCGTTKQRGTSHAQMLRGIRAVGLRGALKRRGSFTEIETFVKKNIPVIVSWFLVDISHYAVVVGIDKRKIYLIDPATGRRVAYRKEVFLRVWFSFAGDLNVDKKHFEERFYIVAIPRRSDR